MIMLIRMLIIIIVAMMLLLLLFVIVSTTVCFYSYYLFFSFAYLQYHTSSFLSQKLHDVFYQHCVEICTFCQNKFVSPLQEKVFKELFFSLCQKEVV